MHLLRIEEQAAFPVADESIVGEAVPEPGDDIIEFAGTMITLAMLHMFVEAEIESGIGVRRRNDVPAGTAATDMIERGETPGDMIRLVEGGGGSGNEADALRHRRQRGQQREGLERGDGVAAPERLDRHIESGKMIGHEEGVEFRPFQRLRE